MWIKKLWFFNKTPSQIYGSKNWEPFGEKENKLFESFLIKNNTEEYEKKLDIIHKKHGIKDELIAKTIINFVDDKIKSNSSFSIIRSNDGEGTLLFGDYFKEYNKSSLDIYITKRISQIIFGSHNVIANDIDQFRALLKDSIESADIIGIPEHSFIRRKLNNENIANVDVRAVLGSYSQVCYIYDEKKNNKQYSKKITSPWLSKYLLPHYGTILKKFSYVSIITGNKGLGEKIKTHFLLENVNEISIPSQRSMSNKLSELHWPDRYYSVLEEISKLPKGSLVLVAAGILGKSYCHFVKLSGSNAIDIGHVADIWHGKITRPGVKDEVVEKWAL